MSIQAAKREERSARFQRAIQKLKEEFPLEHRIANALPEIQTAYVQVLRHWLEQAAPPGKDIVSAVALDALTAMDAVVVDAHGIGCYPFSARDTGIHAHIEGKSVWAMCALDALAIARLSRKASRVSFGNPITGGPHPVWRRQPWRIGGGFLETDVRCRVQIGGWGQSPQSTVRA